MPVIQLIFMAIVAVTFLLLMVVVAWYIVLPLIILWLVLGGVQWLREKWYLYREKIDSNGCTIRKAPPKHQSETTVIDVDYTILK